MPEPQRGMGRGLAAILSISDAGARDDAPELRELAVELIRPNPAQPRKRFDEDGARGARRARSAERGVLQPVLVRPRPGGSYELVAGERRWRAAQLAGLETMPALVQHRDDAASLEVALVENMAREDLNPVEAARAVAALVEELGLTREEVGRRVGRSRVAISNLLRLLDLPDEALAWSRRARSARATAARCCWPTTTATAAAWPAPRSRAAGRCACSSSAPARPNAARAPPRRGRAAAASRPGGRRRARSPRRSAPRWAPRSASARAAPATRSSSPSTALDDALALAAPRCARAPSRSRRAALHCRAAAGD